MAKKKKATSSQRPEIVQWYNKETDRYVKFERATATVISEKVTAGPYKNIHIAKRRPVVRKRKVKQAPVKPKRVTRKQVKEAVKKVKTTTKKKTPTKKKTAKKPAAPKKPRKKNYLNNKDMLEEVMKSKEQGQMTDKLAHMLQTLCARYGRRGNFANYTYNEDMQAYAMYMLVRTWNNFNPEKSKNPFAFFTQCVKNSFIQYLNHEKRHRTLRDELMVDKGLNPSYTYQLEHEAKQEANKTALHEEKEDYTKNQTTTKDENSSENIVEY